MSVGGVWFDVCTEWQVVAAVREAISRGLGGRIITPNVDILRQARRYGAVRAYLADATFVVADGMPLVWASQLAGTPVPERVCGASLIWSLAAGLGWDGRSIYLLGGEPASPAARAGVPSLPHQPGPAGATGPATGPADGAADGARRAADRLVAASPGLRVAGCHSPAYGFERDPVALAEVCGAVVEAKPDLVYVGLGFPKQEWLISKLRADLPFSWFLGCGAAVNFVAGEQNRAPGWMQRTGLEWAHRLATEPRRLGGRYLCHDLPYAVRLLTSACVTRYRRPGLK